MVTKQINWNGTNWYNSLSPSSWMVVIRILLRISSHLTCLSSKYITQKFSNSWNRWKEKTKQHRNANERLKKHWRNKCFIHQRIPFQLIVSKVSGAHLKGSSAQCQPRNLIEIELHFSLSLENNVQTVYSAFFFFS